MERYFYYYLACVPLCIPSFLIVFKVVKRKLLESVFNQQIVLMILLNGKYNRNPVQTSDQIDPNFSNYHLDISSFRTVCGVDHQPQPLHPVLPL